MTNPRKTILTNHLAVFPYLTGPTNQMPDYSVAELNVLTAKLRECLDDLKPLLHRLAKARELVGDAVNGARQIDEVLARHFQNNRCFGYFDKMDRYNIGHWVDHRTFPDAITALERCARELQQLSGLQHPSAVLVLETQDDPQLMEKVHVLVEAIRSGKVVLVVGRQPGQALPLDHLGLKQLVVPHG